MRVVVITRTSGVATDLVTMMPGIGHSVVGVICPPTSTLEAFRSALEDQTPLVAIQHRRDLNAALASFGPDVAICLGCPWRIPLETISSIPFGILNIHPSQLPKYRGPFPEAHAILNGESEIGLTIHRMNERFDAGPILAQSTMPLDESLWFDDVLARLRSLFLRLVPLALERVARDERGDEQAESAATYAGPLGDELHSIDPMWPARYAHRVTLAWRFVRDATYPHWDIDGQRFHIKRTSLRPTPGALRVECSDGPIWLVEMAELPGLTNGG